MVEKTKLQAALKAAADHAQFKIAQAQSLLEKPSLEVDELQGISRVVDQLKAVSSAPDKVASYDCVG